MIVWTSSRIPDSQAHPASARHPLERIACRRPAIALAVLIQGAALRQAQAADGVGLAPFPLALALALTVAVVTLGLYLRWRAFGGSGFRLWPTSMAENRFRAAVDLSPDAILVHSSGRIVYANQSAAALLRASGPEQLMGLELLALVHPDSRDQAQQRIDRQRQGLAIAPEEQRYMRFDGTVVDVEVTASLFRHKGHFSVQVFMRDITERKYTELKLKRLTNLYCALSETSRAVARFHDRDRLLHEICRIAVEFGRLQTTWIGIVDEAERRMLPVAAFGPAEAYVQQVIISTDESRPEGRGPAGMALREGRTYISHDVESDPQMAPWRESARTYGLRTVAAFPLRQGERVIGGILHYADEAGFFDDDLVGLLERMAGEISFALDSIESRRKWVAAESALLETKRELETLLGNLPGMAYRCRYDDRLTMELVSEGCMELTGYGAEDLLLNRLLSYQDLTYPDDRPRVRHEIGQAVAARARFTVEYRIVDRAGKPKWVSEKGLGFYSDRGEVVALEGFISDITEVKSYRERLEHQANHDALTGLANRNLLHDRLHQAIARAEREQRQIAVAFLDLDNFKYLNDSVGHSAGDELLKIVAHRLKACVREGDTVARLGGDEFVLVLVNPGGAEAVNQVMRRVLGRASEPFSLAGREFQTSASLGISLYPQDGTDAESLLKNADAAMYRAKAQGRNNFLFFTPEFNRALSERLALEDGLRQALERGEFLLDYQAKVNLVSGKLIGAEALVRWRHPEHGLLLPDRFIPVAEETGLVVPIGEWILRAACAQTQRWRTQGLDIGMVSVNISARQFRAPELVNQVAGVLAQTGLPAVCLDLEITESLMIENVQEFIARLQALKRLGIQLSVDDFGTGYSSLNYLKQFPIDRLKIDRSFVCDIASDPGDAAIVQVVIQLGHVLGLAVTAEGVETSEQLAFLRLHGCDEGQGYYFSRPLNPTDFEQLLRDEGASEPRDVALRLVNRGQAYTL